MRLRRPSFETTATCAFVLLGIAWGGFLGTRQIAGIDSGLDRLENLTVDWRFLLAGARPAPRGVVIVAIDDETIREAGGYPLPRGLLARMMRGLAAHDPQAVALDILFLDPGQPDADRELADALRATRSVVAAIGLFDHEGAPVRQEPPRSTDLDLVPEPSMVRWPIEAVRNAARSGLVNIVTDHAGVPRHIPMIFRSGERIVPSFALVATSVALSTEPVLSDGTLKVSARPVRLDLGYHLPIRYYGPHGSFRQISAARILRGDIDRNDLRGQVVLLGATAVGLRDTFATPFDRIVPGVEVFATAISNLMAGDGLIKTRTVRTVDASAALLLPAVMVLLMAMRRTWLGLTLASLVFGLWGATTFVAFAAGYWLSIAVPLAALVPVVVGYGLVRLARDRYVAGRLTGEKAALARFQSPHLVAHLSTNPRFLEAPVAQQAAVVFLDLSGFTEVAETLGPKWARDLLADFHALIERDIVEHDGFVVSFLGDGAMVLFGLPEARPDDASRAVLAIEQLGASITAWLQNLPPVAKDRLSARIGGHFGPVVASRLGPRHHQHVTATGDTVNVASRLLEVARLQRSTLVVSEDLWAAAKRAPDAGNLALAGPREVSIRGRTRPLRVLIGG